MMVKKSIHIQGISCTKADSFPHDLSAPHFIDPHGVFHITDRVMPLPRKKLLFGFDESSHKDRVAAINITGQSPLCARLHRKRQKPSSPIRIFFQIFHPIFFCVILTAGSKESSTER